MTTCFWSLEVTCGGEARGTHTSVTWSSLMRQTLWGTNEAASLPPSWLLFNWVAHAPALVNISCGLLLLLFFACLCVVGSEPSSTLKMLDDSIVRFEAITKAILMPDFLPTGAEFHVQSVSKLCRVLS